MGYNSSLQFDYQKDSCRFPKGRQVVELIDRLMIGGWDIGIEGYIHLLDKGNDFDFIVFPKSLSNYVKIVQLFEYKEVNDEPVLVDLDHPIVGNIQVFFFFDKPSSVKVDLHGEDKNIKFTEPVKSINKYLALIYKPFLEWGEVTAIKYISGYDAEVIKEIKGNDILKQIKDLIESDD